MMLISNNVYFVILIAGIILQAIFVAIYNIGNHYKIKLLLKTFASLCFVLCGLMAIINIILYNNIHDYYFAIIIFIGLFFGFLADVFLAFRFFYKKDSKNYNKFLILGTVLFAINHFLYIGTMCVLSFSPITIFLILLAMCLSYFITLFLFKKRFIQESFRLISFLYFFIILCEFFLSLFLLLSFNQNDYFLTKHIGSSIVIFAIGCLLFAISDFITIYDEILLDKNRKFAKFIAVADLPLYYAGQMLIAFSIFTISL